MGIKKQRNVEVVTVAIYIDDHQDITEMCRKGQTYPDKLHEMIKEEKKRKAKQ